MCVKAKLMRFIWTKRHKRILFCFLFSLVKEIYAQTRASICGHPENTEALLSPHSACEVATIWIFSHKHGGYKRTAWQQQMKNKFPLFPTISSARHYHTDRSVTFLPDTLEANEKSLGWKMLRWTCDLFRKGGCGERSIKIKTANRFWINWID